MGNRELGKFGVSQVSEVSRNELGLLDQVQERLDQYHECLGRDLQFDVEVAQGAEQLMIRRLSEMSPGMNARDLRLSILALNRFRTRTHDSLVKVAELAKSRHVRRLEARVESDVVDQAELLEALGVLGESGLLEDSEEVARVIRTTDDLLEDVGAEGDSDAVQAGLSEAEAIEASEGVSTEGSEAEESSG